MCTSGLIATNHYLTINEQPDDYISVFSLRNWAKLRGDVLTTEQVREVMYGY